MIVSQTVLVNAFLLEEKGFDSDTDLSLDKVNDPSRNRFLKDQER